MDGQAAAPVPARGAVAGEPAGPCVPALSLDRALICSGMIAAFVGAATGIVWCSMVGIVPAAIRLSGERDSFA